MILVHHFFRHECWPWHAMLIFLSLCFQSFKFFISSSLVNAILLWIVAPGGIPVTAVLGLDTRICRYVAFCAANDDGEAG